MKIFIRENFPNYGNKCHVILFLFIVVSSLHAVTPRLLTIKDLNTVQNETWSAHTKWYNIGLKLGILADTLDAISKDKQSCNDRYTEMLKQWLRRSDPKPTWDALANALRSCSVDEGAPADQLHVPHVDEGVLSDQLHERHERTSTPTDRFRCSIL